MSRAIQVVPYDPNWPHIYEKEAALIKSALGENCLALHHIGSTSVPGLAAKPIIDMIPVVRNITKVDNYNSAMEALGYISRGECGIPCRRFFQKEELLISYNIHAFEQDDPEIERHIRFRDWMRAHPQDMEAYANLKLDLAEQFPNDISSYCFRKEFFIASIDQKAGQCVLRFVYNDLTTKEWQAAKHFRDTYFFGSHGIDDPYTWTFKHEEHAHLVLYQGVEIVAYAHIQFWPDKRAAIRIIATDENKRNQSFGSKFLELIEK
ncbi:Putative GrpB family GrpB nucleotidyltransferase [Candidatus Trichorickettsia mobilis]|uniref:GrpB family GrpB nucleotidyltransferase n=1 Tax=Candidatus Trichorickettsia mobilis TaxID=1346319 RepID=A0ABZ0UXA7_9RICK|nr:GrpB family protein [Candidatus Trichorickettsia mobilis]WPY00704.1 Putative GrpB family GrpB nucleotidyltransferase [Candidatus Trichorickettsia mobilis]